MARKKLDKIKKRDGRIVDFDRKKIENAIWAAARTLGGKDKKLAEELSHKVFDYLKETLPAGEIPTVEQVQDAVEKILIEEGHARTAKCYILYRQKRAEIRRAKKLLGVSIKLPFSSFLKYLF
jgi:anaerobic ribonucleoside-triphosphate reductase